MENIQFLLSDAHGQYIPKKFVTDFDLSKFSSIDQDDVEICKDPDHEQYWDAWYDICTKAKYTHKDGRVFTLHQDGDLWLICYDKMTPEEHKNFGFDQDDQDE